MKDLQIYYHWHLENPPAGTTVWPYCAGKIVSYGNSDCHAIQQQFCIHMIRDGAGCVVIDQRAYTLRTGDLFIFCPGQEIRYYDTPETAWQLYCIYLGGPGVDEFVNQLGFTSDQPFIRPVEQARIGGIFDKLWRLLRDHPAHGEYRVISTLFMLPTLCAENQSEKQENSTTIKQTLTLIKTARPPENVNVNRICGRLGMSRTTLYRRFIQQEGTTPTDFLIEHKLKKAREMLRSSTRKIAEIAILAGFNSDKYFFRIFKQRFGQTPAAYRRTASAGK